MKFLHTSDWHLGANIEGLSRLNEQEQFIEELFGIVEENNIDLIIVAGDIFDTANPPSNAQKLFYNAVKKLCNKKRPMVIISGNHDSPDRLSAPSHVLYENGGILISLPNSVAEIGDYGFYKILNSTEGFFEIEIGKERAAIVTMPFPNEKRLNDLFSLNLSEAETQQNFSSKIGAILHNLAENYRNDTINILTGHFHIVGGFTSSSERDIAYGGSYAVNSKALPKNADYIAMGHLHRSQKVASIENGFYSGSPIKYSLSEKNYKKVVYLINKSINTSLEITEIPLTDYKPIEEWNADNIETAISICEEYQNKDCWVYLNIKSEKPIPPSDYKKLFAIKKDIVYIHRVHDNEIKETIISQTEETKTKLEEFIDFYTEINKTEPTKELLDLFAEIDIEDK